MAVTLRDGDYQAIQRDLYWRLLSDNVSVDSRESAPLFVVAPGTYRLIVSHPEYGEKEVHGIVLNAAEPQDELVYLGQTGIDDSEENYHLNDNAEFDSDKEYQRRVADRAEEQRYGDMASELRDPNLLGPEAGVDQALETAQQNGLQSHPVLGQAAQFDGVAAKMNPNVAENVHAAEAQKDPELQPGAKPKLGRDSTPQFRPGGM
jgi:hypothetical protein